MAATLCSAGIPKRESAKGDPMKVLKTVLLVSLLAGSNCLLAQTDEPFPEEARKRLDHASGRWHSETDSLGPDGQVRSTSSSDDERRFAILQVE